MTSNSNLAYPAEYYYPEFLDNRPDDPLKSPPARVPLTSSVNNGIGSSTNMPLTSTIYNRTDLSRTTTKKRPVHKEQIPTTISLRSPNDYKSDLSTKPSIKTTTITKIRPVNREQSLSFVPVTSSIHDGTGLSTKVPMIPTTKKQPVNHEQFPTTIPLTSSIDNGTGLSTKIPTTTIITKKTPINKNQGPTNLALDVVTDQGLADTDITRTVKTDPKRNLVRDPAERNIPRLIVDDTVIKQAVRAPRIVTTNLNHTNQQTPYSNQTNNVPYPYANGYPNGYANGDLTKKPQPPISTKQQKVKSVEDEQPIDDYWKKEVHINEDGVVTIDPLTYDKNTYEGPFGLTRQGSFIFYISLGILTLLAGVFLIMTGVFYSQNYPSSSSSTGTLTGLCICALAFYLGLQLILIALWHQKYRQENPKKIAAKSNKHNDSSINLKTSMEENEPYNYSYQPPMDYAPYPDYSNAYVSNVNEQMLLQQPGAATGAGSYEEVVWPSNVQVETQIDPKFLQPMDWSYGPQSIIESPLTATGYAPATNALDTNNNLNITADNTTEKKHRHHRRHHHHHKKTVEAEPPKPIFDSIQTTSSVIEPPLPVLSKAPETNELLKAIADAEKNAQHTSINKNSNRVESLDGEADNISLTGNHHHRHHRHHRRHSYSSCSTCSDRSRNNSHSDLGHTHNHHDHHRHHHHHHQYPEPVEQTVTPRPLKSQSLSPRRRNRNVHREAGTGTGFDTRRMKDSGITADLEDVPNVRDDRREPFPIVRRTIIVEPYPAEPTSEVFVKPESNMIGQVRLSRDEHFNGNDDAFIHSPTRHVNKKSKKKKKSPKIYEDLQLEDVNGDHDDGNENTKSRKRNTSRTKAKKHVKKNAFYD